MVPWFLRYHMVHDYLDLKKGGLSIWSNAFTVTATVFRKDKISDNLMIKHRKCQKGSDPTPGLY